METHAVGAASSRATGYGPAKSLPTPHLPSDSPLGYWDSRTHGFRFDDDAISAKNALRGMMASSMRVFLRNLMG